MDFKDIPGSGVNLPYDDLVKVHGRLNAIERYVSPDSTPVLAAIEVIREILGGQAATADDDSAEPLDRALRAGKAVEAAYEAQDREAYDRASECLMLAVLGMGTADRARYSRIMSTRPPHPMWPLVP